MWNGGQGTGVPPPKFSVSRGTEDGGKMFSFIYWWLFSVLLILWLVLFGMFLYALASFFYRLKKLSKPPVRTENSDSGVLVMKPAHQGIRHDATDPLNRARDRRIFVQ